MKCKQCKHYKHMILKALKEEVEALENEILNVLEDYTTDCPVDELSSYRATSRAHQDPRYKKIKGLITRPVKVYNKFS